MKIGISTLASEFNYGAFLQAAALVEALRRLDHDPIMYQYDRQVRHPWYRKYAAKSVSSFVRKLRIAQYNREGNRVFSQSQERLLPLTQKTYTYKNISELSQEGCEVNISGSDQVWNPMIIDEKDWPFYNLEWASDSTMRLSYAASFGMSKPKKSYLDYMQRVLPSFRKLGVREGTGVELLKNQGFGELASRVLDPTLLFSKEDYGWMNCSQSTNSGTKDYILSYVLNSANSVKEKVVTEKLASEHDLQNVRVPTAASSDLKRPYHVYSPQEFVALFRDASFVVTDSFHGIAYSINFNKPFIFIPWDGDLAYRNGRVINLLQLAGLTAFESSYQDHLKGVYCAPTAEEWQKCNELLESERTSSLAFLNEGLNFRKTEYIK